MGNYSKKGQFYIFTALILSVASFVLIQSGSFNADSRDDFDILVDNYVHEGKNIINNALYEDKEVFLELQRYTDSFGDFANSKNINLNILFMYIHNDKVNIKNQLGKSVVVYSKNSTINNYGTETFNQTDWIVIEFNSESYNFTTDKSIDFKVLAIKE